MDRGCFCEITLLASPASLGWVSELAARGLGGRATPETHRASLATSFWL